MVVSESVTVCFTDTPYIALNHFHSLPPHVLAWLLLSQTFLPSSGQTTTLPWCPSVYVMGYVSFGLGVVCLP